MGERLQGEAAFGAVNSLRVELTLYALCPHPTPQSQRLGVGLLRLESWSASACPVPIKTLESPPPGSDQSPSLDDRKSAGPANELL